MRLLYPTALYHAYLMLPHQAPSPPQIGPVVEEANVPDIESDSTALADSIDAPFCFVGPS